MRKDGKRTFTVSTPVGTFSRTTARSYTRLVVSCGMDEQILIGKQLREIDFQRTTLNEYRAVMAGQRAPVCSIESYPGFIASLERLLAELPEQHEQALLANRLVIAERRGELVGWSQSAAGAARMATDAIGQGRLGVTIYEVNQ